MGTKAVSTGARSERRSILSNVTISNGYMIFDGSDLAFHDCRFMNCTIMVKDLDTAEFNGCVFSNCFIAEDGTERLQKLITNAMISL